MQQIADWLEKLGMSEYAQRFTTLDESAGQLVAVATEQDADVLQVLIGKMGKDRDVDAVLRKCADVLGQAEPCEPIGNFLHRRPHPTEFGLVDPLDGRFERRRSPRDCEAWLRRRRKRRLGSAGASPKPLHHRHARRTTIGQE
jgi:hypothetical protein